VTGRLIGRYEVRRVLGSGGFATVYLALDAGLDTAVAVKVLAENWAQDADITRRFVEEARLLRRCDDDRVVRVHTIEELEDGRPYFVMDFADRGALADRMAAAVEAGRPFSPAEAVAISRELATCLAVIHDRGIVHRDLKPGNVLFRTVSGGGELMLLGDFGLARQLVGASGRTVSAGTPAYVAPEQADPALAGTVDERADVYAAAVILYELLAGELPFGEGTLDQVPRRGPVPELGREDVPESVREVVRQGMAVDPAARYPSGAAWASALDGLVASVGEAAVPPAPAAFMVDAVRPGRSGPATVPPVPPWEGVAAVTPAVRAGVGPSGIGPSGVGTVGSLAPAGDGTGRRRVWPVLAAVVAAAVVIVAGVVLLVGRHSGNPSSVALTLPPATTFSPASTTAPTTTAPPPGSAVAGWFAAASGPGCSDSVSPPAINAVVSSITCDDDGIDAVFAEVGSTVDANAYLDNLLALHKRAVGSFWYGGRVVYFDSAGRPSVAWSYDAGPYVGTAVGPTRVAVDAWWKTARDRA
jgi:hypothetical protein